MHAETWIALGVAAALWLLLLAVLIPVHDMVSRAGSVGWHVAVATGATAIAGAQVCRDRRQRQGRG